MVAGTIDHRIDPFGAIDHFRRKLGAGSIYLYFILSYDKKEPDRIDSRYSFTFTADRPLAAIMGVCLGCGLPVAAMLCLAWMCPVVIGGLDEIWQSDRRCHGENIAQRDLSFYRHSGGIHCEMAQQAEYPA